MWEPHPSDELGRDARSMLGRGLIRAMDRGKKQHEWACLHALDLHQEGLAYLHREGLHQIHAKEGSPTCVGEEKLGALLVVGPVAMKRCQCTHIDHDVSATIFDISS